MSTVRGALGVALLLVACGGDEEGEAAPAAAKSSGPARAAATTAPAASPDEAANSYSPIGKRDPFTSYLADLQADDKPAQQRKLEPTETFELDQYRLTGLITGTSQPKAMVEDPTSTGHVVRIGSRLGKNGGVVTRITSNAIVVTEEFRTPTGDKVRVPITIKMPEPELDLAAGQ